MSLKGKTLFITGASRGIGLAIAIRAAREGANIAAIAKTANPHSKLPGTIYTAAEEIAAAGGKALPLVADVRDAQAIESAVELVLERFGGKDICVNNAPAIGLTESLETDPKHYDLMHQINVRGTFLVSRTCVPYLRRVQNPQVVALSALTEPSPTMNGGARDLHHEQVFDEHAHGWYGGGVPR